MDIDILVVIIGLFVVGVTFIGYKFGLPKLLNWLGGKKEAKEKLKVLDKLFEKLYAVSLLIADDEKDIYIEKAYEIISFALYEADKVLELEGDLSPCEVYDVLITSLDSYDIKIGGKEQALIDTAVDLICEYLLFGRY